MADISSSAAKEHALKAAGEVQRISAEAVQKVRDFAHAFLQRLGAAAARSATKNGRKTIMPPDVEAAARELDPTPVVAGVPEPSGEVSPQ